MVLNADELVGLRTCDSLRAGERDGWMSRRSRKENPKTTVTRMGHARDGRDAARSGGEWRSLTLSRARLFACSLP